DFHSYIPNPAMRYPFTLDTFQQQAVARLERNESVFVAAHTSAGKTVVAEYAVALAKQRGTRCIYTSPIKALSNQKFRDFSLKFGSENVGLITGDLQVNADDSTCLIMTTEILRSMLYRGADLIRDIEFVVFDEVHYINDSERGVVWEEVIIMLPAYVNMIFLSATTPNTFEFSDWIGRTKRRPVYVMKTNYRPVPLSHYLWANLKLHTVKEGNSKFYDKGHQEASKALRPKDNKNNNGNNGKSKPVPKSTGRGPKNMEWQAQGSKAQWMSLIRFLEREDLTPTVVFSFSKKKCEEIANMLRSLSLNTASECSAVQGFTLQTIARLSPIDQTLPQVLIVCEMVKRGIGIHHGGLLPILKEMVEILFSRNLIKVLFATETFAMGVNMPAKAVVYNSIRKHDGTQFRVLEPGEYTQMAGRAGRRGLDKVGTVIMCCFGETPPPIGMLRNMLTGSSTMLRSQFRLTYNMILNLLRVEEMSVESMIKRSFSEFATQRALTSKEYPKLLARGQKTLLKLQEQFDAEAEQRIGAEDIEEYFSSCNQLMELNSELLLHITNSNDGSGDAVLQPGRIILISSARKHEIVRAPALILESEFSSGGATSETSKILESLVCMVLLPEHHISEGKEDQNESKARSLNDIGSSMQRYYGIYQIKLNQILFSSSETEIENVMEVLIDAEKAEMSSGMPLLNMLDFLTRGSDIVELRNRGSLVDELAVQLRSCQSHSHRTVIKYYALLERIYTLQERVQSLSHLLSNESLQLFPDFLHRKSVLRTLGYLDENETVAVKGRVACEVNTCDELIVTEMVFEGILNDLDPTEIVAALSALIYQQKSNDDEFDIEVPESLLNCCKRMKTIAINLGQLQKDHGLDVDPLDYAESSMKFGLVHVVYEWAIGVPFCEICQLTDAQEGSIVRCITRLDELCREVRNCARVVGNPTLYRKMEAASTAIKRDIVFAASLYVS
ncbi:antiviral helicase, partial [Fragilariopsis cylindrus CCMP1102]